MRVLVTGADGFIGGVLVQALRSLGHDVVGVVYTRPAAHAELRIDLTHEAELVQLPRDREVVVHAAGLVDARSPELMLAVNVHGAQHMARWAAAVGVKHFVQLSSVAVYGPRTIGEGRGEDTPRYGLYAGLPYMRTKAMAERAIEASGVDYTILRPCAVIGAGDTVLSRSMVTALSEGGLPLLPGASPLRRVSVLDVHSLAQVVARLLERGPLRMPVHVANYELALFELAQAYADAAGLSLQFQNVSWAEVRQLYADSGRMWLLASARFGQSYRTDRLARELGTWPAEPLEKAVKQAVSSLQGG